MERQKGYYWINHSNQFKIAFWDGECWYMIDCPYGYEDFDFEHINENRIKYPGELPD